MTAHPDADSRLEAVWLAVADRRLKQRAGKVVNVGAWRREVAYNARRDQWERACELVARFPDLTVAELAACLDGDTACLRYHRQAPVEEPCPS